MGSGHPERIHAILEKAYTNEQGELTISKEELDARTDAALVQLDELNQEFQERIAAGEQLTWVQFIEDKRDTIVAANKLSIETLKMLPQSSILSKITSFDYSAIAGGNGDAY